MRKLRKFKIIILVFLSIWLILSLLTYLRKNEYEKVILNKKLNKRNLDDFLDKLDKFNKINNNNVDENWKESNIPGVQIFSAFIDSRPEIVLEEISDAGSKGYWALVRIIGIIPISLSNSKLMCHYKYLNNSDYKKSSTISVKLVAYKENFDMRYSASFIICPLLLNDNIQNGYPYEVTITNINDNINNNKNVNFVKINYNPSRNEKIKKKFMSVCVPPLHHNYNNFKGLIEFIEFYKLMGADHLTFYNSSISDNVNKVLNYYKNKNIINVLQWKLPKYYLFERTLRYEGIYASLNDCLYRNSVTGDYKYVINVDLDEFIMPRKFNNFYQIMDYLDPFISKNEYASFIIRNAFFYLMHQNDPMTELSSLNVTRNLILFNKTTRYVKFNRGYDRSKYIVRGYDIVEMGNHRVWLLKSQSNQLFGSRYKETIVDPEIAALHHYRNCETNEEVCWLRETVVDNIAHKYTNELALNFFNTYNNIFNK